MSFDLPYTILMNRAHQEGMKDGRALENKEICEFIENTHPTLIWLAEAIRHGEFK